MTLALTLTGDCPDCGAVLRVRENRRNSDQFIGCSRYPKCRFSTPIIGGLLESAVAQLESATYDVYCLRPQDVDTLLRRLIFEFHPDRHDGPIAAERVVAELNRIRSETRQ